MEEYLKQKYNLARNDTELMPGYYEGVTFYCFERCKDNNFYSEFDFFVDLFFIVQMNY